MANLETLQDRLRKLETQIADEKGRVEAEKAVGLIGGKVATAITVAVKAAKLDIQVLSGKFFALKVDEAGKLTVDLVAKASGGGGGKSNGNGHSNGNGNGNGHTYTLADGRPFARLVDAVEALQGKACVLKHDGRTYDDGKPVLRHDRLTNDLKGAITQVEKPAETPPAETPSADPPAETPADPPAETPAG